MSQTAKLAALLLLAAALPIASAQRTTPPFIKNAFWQPNDLQQGSPAFFTVELSRVPRRLSGKWIDKELTFFKSSNPKIWYALAGADLETPPNTYELNLTAVMANGKVVHDTKSINIEAGNFQTSEVQVPQNFVEPNDAEKKQIAEDQQFKNRAFAHLISTPEWSGNFITPVNAKSTPSFGATRLFNEELTSTHRGTDFPIKEGAPVVASNSGTVVLAKALFYEGNCVIIDHGQRFFTIYMHMSSIEVRAGQQLKKGTRIGLTGATGRVTGPHLHMGVRWNDAYLDPTKLLGLTLPKLHEPPKTRRRLPTPQRRR